MQSTPATLTRLTLTILLTLSTSAAATFNIADGDVAGLISAVHAANANGEADTINLAANGTYILTAVAEDDGYWGPTGIPYIRSQVAINGNGATIRRSSDANTPKFRILFVFVGNLTLDRVTLAGGDVYAYGAGGGLGMTTSRAVIRNSTITGNHATVGGGIHNFCSTVDIENSTISYNTAYGDRTGGGILTFSSYCQNAPWYSSHTTISFSTIFENRADGDPGFEGRGDAVADGYSAPGSIIVKNSIFASPTGAGGACYGTSGVLVSLGFNIGGDTTCGLTATGDLTSTNPLLGPLAANGGPTLTHLPLTGSPAIDAVPTGACTNVNGSAVLTDQRGVARPSGSACDIGSVDVAAAPTYQVCLLYDSTRAVNSGAVVPIKLQICDASGANLSGPQISLHATGITRVSTSITGPVQDAGNANPDNDFRYDSALGLSGGYVFNLKTTGLPTGSYHLNFTVAGSSSAYVAPFQVR